MPAVGHSGVLALSDTTPEYLLGTRRVSVRSTGGCCSRFYGPCDWGSIGAWTQRYMHTSALFTPPCCTLTRVAKTVACFTPSLFILIVTRTVGRATEVSADHRRFNIYWTSRFPIGSYRWYRVGRVFARAPARGQTVWVPTGDVK